MFLTCGVLFIIAGLANGCDDNVTIPGSTDWYSCMHADKTLNGGCACNTGHQYSQDAYDNGVCTYSSCCQQCPNVNQVECVSHSNCSSSKYCDSAKNCYECSWCCSHGDTVDGGACPTKCECSNDSSNDSRNDSSNDSRNDSSIDSNNDSSNDSSNNSSNNSSTEPTAPSLDTSRQTCYHWLEINGGSLPGIDTHALIPKDDAMSIECPFMFTKCIDTEFTIRFSFGPLEYSAEISSGGCVLSTTQCTSTSLINEFTVFFTAFTGITIEIEDCEICDTNDCNHPWRVLWTILIVGSIIICTGIPAYLTWKCFCKKREKGQVHQPTPAASGGILMVSAPTQGGRVDNLTGTAIPVTVAAPSVQ